MKSLNSDNYEDLGKNSMKNSNKPILSLEQLRLRIDDADHDIIAALSKRMNYVKLIGQYKQAHDLGIVDQNRWENVLKTRTQQAKSLGLSPKLILEIFEVIHRYSIKIQQK